MASKKPVKKTEDRTEDRCPHCGYCPHCGQSTKPQVVPMPFFPYREVPRPHWYGEGGYKITCAGVEREGNLSISPELSC